MQVQYNQQITIHKKKNYRRRGAEAIALVVRDGCRYRDP